MNKPIQVKRKHLVELYVSMVLMTAMAMSFAVWTQTNYAEEQTKARMQARVPVCRLLEAFKLGYEEQAPSTPSGARQRESVLQLYALMQCDSVLKNR